MEGAAIMSKLGKWQRFFDWWFFNFPFLARVVGSVGRALTKWRK